MKKIICLLILSISCLAQTRIKVASLNNILFTDQFPGATLDVRVNACLAKLAATVASGGTCDARGEVLAKVGSAPQALTIAATITIGSQQIVIWPSANLIVTCTITNATPCIYVNNQATLTSFGHGVNEGYITLSSSANVSSVIKVGAGGSGVNASTHDLISHIEVYGAASATVGQALVDIPSVYDSTFDHLSVVSGGYGGKLLYIHDVAASEGTGQNDFYSLLLDCSYVASCIPLSIIQNNSGGVSDMRFFGGDYGHPGLNQNMININGNVSGGGIPAIKNITFYGPYLECCSGVTVQATALVNIQDANTVSFFNAYMLENASSSGPCVNIADGGQNATTNINFQSAACSTGAHNFIVNNIDTNYSVTNAMAYSYLTDYSFINKNRSDGEAMIGNVQFQPAKFGPCSGGFCYDMHRDSGTGWMFFAGSGQSAGANGHLFQRPVQENGTTQTSGNVVLGAGWGTGATVTSVTGSQWTTFTITSGSASYGAAPTVTVTFPDGMVSGITPQCTLNVTDITGAGGAIMFKLTTASQTAPVFTAKTSTGAAFTPAVTETYTVTMQCL